MKSMIYLLFSLIALYGCNTPKKERFVEPVSYIETADDGSVKNQFINKHWLSRATGWEKIQIVEKDTGKIVFEHEYNADSFGVYHIFCENDGNCELMFGYTEKNFFRTEHCIIAPLNYKGRVRDNPEECR